MTYIIIKKYNGIRRPLLFAQKGQARIVWFRSWDSNYPIAFFEDIPEKYPRWDIGIMSATDASTFKAKLTDEGWEVLIYERREIKKLREKELQIKN